MATAKAKSLKGGRKFAGLHCPMGFHPKTKRAVRAKKVSEFKVVKPPKVTITDPVTERVRRAVLTGKSHDGTFLYSERGLTIGIKAKLPSTIEDPERIHRIIYGQPLPPKMSV